MGSLTVQQRLDLAIQEHRNASNAFRNKKDAVIGKLYRYVNLPWLLLVLLPGSWYMYDAVVPLSFPTWLRVMISFEIALIACALPAYVVVGLVLEINYRWKYAFYRVLTPKTANRMYVIARGNDYSSSPQLTDLHKDLTQKMQHVKELMRLSTSVLKQTYEFVDTCTDDDVREHLLALLPKRESVLFYDEAVSKIKRL